MEVVVQASIQYLADHYIIKTLIDNGWYSLQKCLVWYNTPNEGGGGGGGRPPYKMDGGVCRKFWTEPLIGTRSCFVGAV